MKDTTVNTSKLKTFASSGLAVAAIALSGVAIYTTQAGAQPGKDGKPVNAPAAISPAPGAPASFADIVQRVAPAVVSIDIEEKATKTAFRGRGPSAEDDGDDDASGALPPGLPPELRRFFEQHGRGGAQQTPDADAPPAKATGSGFFISRDGYIVTNNHVVENAATITVRTNDERELKARLIGRDPATDLAVIKVEDKGEYPYVSFEDKAKPRVGDWVIAVGNPFGLGGTATAGIVSALARQNVSGSSYVDYMQIDAPINRGNSGGPSFDLNGRVVGVNSAIFSPSGGSVGIGFDIPADVAQSVTRDLIAAGKVTRGYIGASVQQVTPEIAESLGLKSKKGALVASLTPGGPAAKSGLQTGDVVTRIDGQDVISNSDLTRRVGMVRVGQDLRLTVIRDGHAQDVTIRAGERPSEEALARNDQQERGPRGPRR